MSIPDYQALMLPFLNVLADEEAHRLKNIINKLADELGLSYDEREELLPSGMQPVFNNRVSWAKTYLTKAGLVESVKQGYHKITELGKQVLNKKPDKIDKIFLSQYESFQTFLKAKNNTQTELQCESSSSTDSIDPNEQLEFAYQQLISTLSSEILDRIKSNSPDFFEHLVIDLLLSMGYGGSRKDAGEVRGKSGDGGIDGIIKEDKLGLDIIYVQAKKYKDTIPIAQVRDFAGALLAHKAKKGIFLTTSDFSDSAYQFVKNIDQRIILINGTRLAELMIEFKVGISVRSTYELCDLDSDYFDN